MALPSYASIVSVIGLTLILFSLVIFLYFLSKIWNVLLKSRVQKALQMRRNHQDEFRTINGYSWDYVMVFKVYEENDVTTAEQAEFNMKTVLAQLADGGCETRLFYGLLRKTVYCKIRVPLQRLCKELDRMDYLLAADPEPLKNLLQQGRPGYWKGITIPEKNYETTLYPYDFIYFQYHYEDPIVAMREYQENGHYSASTLWKQTKMNLYKKYPMYSRSDQIASLGQNTTATAVVATTTAAANGDIHNNTTPNTNALLVNNDESILRGVDRLKVIRAIITSKHVGGCKLDLDKLLQYQAILGFFPLHDIVELKLLEGNWFQIFSWPWSLKINDIKDYFGEQIGLYFQWLSFYTSWLFVAGIVGGINWIWIAAANNNPNTPNMPYFAGFIACWATLFLEYWKRKEKYTAMQWGMVGFEESEVARPAFYGHLSSSPVTGKPVMHFSRFERGVKSCRSGFLILGSMFTVIGELAFIFFIRALLVHFNMNGGVIASSLIFAIQIQISGSGFDVFAIKLNDYENHRTETDYEDALVSKAFAFNFINSYTCLFYIAFFKPFNANIDPCVDSCMDELSVTLGTILLTRLALGNFFEIIHPVIEEYRLKRSIKNIYKSSISQSTQYAMVNYFSNTFSSSSNSNNSQAVDDASDQRLMHQSAPEVTMSEVEATYFLPSYTRLSVFADYSEMVIQFGYATMFVCAFPLATIMCFICNYIELKIDSWKLCQLYRRPEPRSCEDIGTWFTMLDFLSYTAVLTNSGLVAFTGTYSSEFTWAARIWIFLLMSAGLCSIKLVLAYIVPDVPREVEIQLERVNFIRSKVQFNKDDEQDTVKAPRGVPRYLLRRGDDDPL